MGFNVVPVSRLASADDDMDISALPSKGIPLMFLATANLVAVPAFPLTLPVIGAVTVKPVNVPTDVMPGWAALLTV